MLHHFRALMFDVDRFSASSLREALPGWRIDTVYGATVASLPCDWDPGPVDLVILGVREDAEETWGLCRFLVEHSSASQETGQAAGATVVPPVDRQTVACRAEVPLLVLVPSGQEGLIEAGLQAGADRCLLLPIHVKDVASMFVHAHVGHQPGRHTMNFERAQVEDCWRDDGGQC